jgi:dolichol-phosphate mannosyltransferase
MTFRLPPSQHSGADTVRVAVVIPCYKVKRHIRSVIDTIGPEVCRIYVVDDYCPEGSGAFVEQNNTCPRVHVLRNPVNLGVGGAVMRGYRQAIADGMDIVVKIDGDGQMNPRLLPRLIAPIVTGQADYVKGNRFYDLTQIKQMPTVRIIGNAILSFMAKFSTGYWGLFDPTNGLTALAVPVAAHLPLDKISRRFFFETDMLFRLNTLRAVVVDMPMHASYGEETSNLRITRVLPEFLFKHIRNFAKRIFYNYFLRDMSVASLELLVGLVLLVGGVITGGYYWGLALATGRPTPVGTIMLAVLPILIAVQLLLAFLAYDFASTPRRPISNDLDWPDSNHTATPPDNPPLARETPATQFAAAKATDVQA